MSDTTERDKVLRYGVSGYGDDCGCAITEDSYGGYVDYADYKTLHNEVTQLNAAIARVRARHYSIRSYDYDEDAQFCKECGADFPCPTLRILDGAL